MRMTAIALLAAFSGLSFAAEPVALVLTARDVLPLKTNIFPVESKLSFFIDKAEASDGSVCSLDAVFSSDGRADDSGLATASGDVSGMCGKPGGSAVAVKGRANGIILSILRKDGTSAYFLSRHMNVLFNDK